MNTDLLDKIMRQMMAVSNAPGSALAVVQGDTIYTQGYGVRSIGGEVVTPDTLFANASTTKAVTATAVALLVDRGKMAWDNPVRKYLPDFRLSDPVADSLVTIRDLLCHRTGLPRHDMLWYRSDYSRAEVLRRVCDAKLTAPLRTKYQYQNICFLAAGEAVRVASGAESFEAFTKAELLKPLGMERTNFSTHDAEADPNHAEPHKRIKGKVVQTAWLNFDNCGPCGTMNSSAAEMAQWLRFHLNNGKTAAGVALLAESSLHETYLPQMICPVEEAAAKRYPSMTQETYCLGWALRDYKGQSVLHHGGAIDGFRAHVAIVPKRDLAFCVFVNLNQPFVEPVRNAILDLLLDLEAEDWAALCKADIKKIQKDEKEAEDKRRKQKKEGKPSPLPLKDYVGVYDSPAYGAVHITKDNGDLHLSWNRFATALRHQTFSTFVTTDHKEDFGTNEVTFTVSPLGEVVSLSLFDGQCEAKKRTDTVAVAATGAA